ncbi:MAG: hypothetical protein P8010_02490 [Desulfosarcinaceae bacterium]|jgi:hypothetical protein
MATDTAGDKDREWEERTLCSDESCIGVIGPDGRCNECGKPYAGKPADADEEPDEALSLEPDKLLDEAEEEDGPPDDEALDDDEDAHWADRILCRDENCIGIIGPDGRCKECGKPLDEKQD